MSPTEYVMHPDTEIISVAIKVGNAPTDVIFGESEIKRHLDALDWSAKMAIGHNMSGFDAMIMAWRFGIHPKMWGCTAAMARSKYGKTCGVSLKALSKELGIGAKLDLEATNTKGKHLKDFTPAELAAMEEYNKIDTELCAALFKALARGFPRNELVHIDMTTRMLVEPKFELDVARVESALDQVREEKKRSLMHLAMQLGIEEFVTRALDGEASIEEQVREQLASSIKFAALLDRLDVEVPMKPSPTNSGRLVPALAKTDEAFLKLQEHPNPIVAAAARARLDVKSTLLETRLQAFLRAAKACGGRLPVPLKYVGADTTGRWSGEQYNMQNLPRIPRDKEGNIIDKPSNALRLSLRVPEGHKVIVADLSGIELRVNHFLWKVSSSMALFKADPAKADLYKDFASMLYQIAKEEVTKDQRQVGKVAHLGLGFGAGAATFRKVAKLMATIDLSEEEAQTVVLAWRSAYSEIVAGWASFQEHLPKILEGVESSIDPWGLCVTEKNAVRLPSGRRIYYPALTRHRDEETGKSEWWYGVGRHRARIYAGKGVENLVQALARDVIADNALAFRKATGLSPALTVHDELAYVVPQKQADSLLEQLQATMRIAPTWWPELVTWSEGDVADCYGEAK
jgi:DNA polymerase III epsilon subunit-like protein